VNGARRERLLVVTDRRLAEAAGRTLLATVASAVDAGAQEVLLREKDLAPADRHELAVALRETTARAEAHLYVAGDPGLAAEVGADGVHLSAADPWPGGTTDHRRLGVSGPAHRLWLGRSCHTVAELLDAGDHRADWMTYSPVFATSSKPGYGPALGLGGLAQGCQAVRGAAVLALGGIGPGRAVGCSEAGAAGVAVMGAVMRADDPAAAVRMLLHELRTPVPERRAPVTKRRTPVPER
jgi:thiamine-phosphate pyrophosphorylase